MQDCDLRRGRVGVTHTGGRSKRRSTQFQTAIGHGRVRGCIYGRDKVAHALETLRYRWQFRGIAVPQGFGEPGSKADAWTLDDRLELANRGPLEWSPNWLAVCRQITSAANCLLALALSTADNKMLIASLAAPWPHGHPRTGQAPLVVQRPDILCCPVSVQLADFATNLASDGLIAEFQWSWHLQTASLRNRWITSWVKWPAGHALSQADGDDLGHVYSGCGVGRASAGLRLRSQEVLDQLEGGSRPDVLSEVDATGA
jgi:hypothetical protein